VIRIPPRVLYPIAIKPTHSRAQVCSPAPPLVYSLPAIPPCTARDHQQPSSRRSISANWVIPYPIQFRLPASEFSQDEICMYALSPRPPPPPPPIAVTAFPGTLLYPNRSLSLALFSLSRFYAPSSFLLPFPDPRPADCLSPTRYLLLCKAARSA